MNARFLCFLPLHRVNQEEKSIPKKERKVAIRILCYWIITSHYNNYMYK
jgi:hypothetical protein